MKYLFSKILFLTVMVLLTSSTRGEIVTEGMIGSGYKSNLFNDSNSTGDSFTSLGLSLKYYPTASTQFTASGQYNTYANYDDLSNLNGNLSFIFIPTHKKSRASLMFNGYLQANKFGYLYELYNQVNISLKTNINYRLVNWAFLQSSISYLSTTYTNSNFGSNRGFEFSSGVNFTVFRSNAIALEFDYSHRSFDQPGLTMDNNIYGFDYNQINSEVFNITGFLIRYSRPIDSRTGLNISIGQRRLHVDNEYTVPGYSIDYLSPWANLWEGPYLSSKIKHYFPKQITTEFSITYFDKDFVDVIEIDEENDDTFWYESRSDQLTSLSVSISRPILLNNGKLLTPTLDMGWQQNNSTSAYYNYDNFHASLFIKMVF